MTGADTAALAAELAAALRAVPGVVSLFPPNPAGPEATGPPVRVTRSGAELRVEVALGVAGHVGVAGALRDALGTARRALDAIGAHGADVACTVVLIEESRTSDLEDAGPETSGTHTPS